MKLLFIICTICLISDLKAQDNYFGIYNQNFVYLSIDNHLYYFHKEKSTYFLTTDNGRIRKEKNEFEYTYNPQKLGDARVFVYITFKKDSIRVDTIDLFVKPSPLPKLLVNGQVYKLNLDILKTKFKLEFYYENFESKMESKINDFSLLLIEGDHETLYPNLSDRELELQNIIQKLQHGDKLIFYNCSVNLGNNEIQLAPQEFLIQ